MGYNHSVVIFFHNGVKEFHNAVFTTIFMKFFPGRRDSPPRSSGTGARGGGRAVQLIVEKIICEVKPTIFSFLTPFPPRFLPCKV